jgi:hypothetical protein
LLAASLAVSAACGGARKATDSADLPSLAGGEHRWTLALSSDGYASGRDIAVDAQSNFFVVGTFQETLTIGGRRLEAASAGGDDGFVAKISAGGKLEWATRFGGRGPDSARAVAVDERGRAVVAGALSPDATFGNHPLPQAGGPLPTAFVAALDARGGLRWLQVLRSDEYVSISDVALAADGSAVAAGYFGGTVRAEGTALTSAGAHDALFARFSPSGSLAWIRRAGGRAVDHAHAVVARPQRIVVVGGFAARADFAGQEIVSAGKGQDAFVAELTPDGGMVGVHSYGGEGSDTAFAVAVDDTGLLCVAGTFADTASFGGQDLEARGQTDVFVACYAPDGKHVWSRGMGGSESDRTHALGMRAGDVIVAGTFAGSARFAGRDLASAGERDVFAAKLTAAGEPVWARGFGGPGEESLGGLAVDGNGGIAVTGAFSRRVSFGGVDLEARGALDGFVARLTD